ncbi:hypothetical protein HPB50_007731 [Hyalomma asiaticum]|uniref:Uncharacterized protein n=1 Tax=Hyalomma asiaticum TaxID=266040 RepID=A0ACB7S120_HYAAI|nr:hypothetical protein HPB50_007731 [Hyalomma asiaticum]
MPRQSAADKIKMDEQSITEKSFRDLVQIPICVIQDAAPLTCPCLLFKFHAAEPCFLVRTMLGNLRSSFCIVKRSFQSSVGREEHVGMAQSAVSKTYEVTEAIIISVAARAARRKLVDFPPTPWLPRMRRRRRLRYSATSQAC